MKSQKFFNELIACLEPNEVICLAGKRYRADEDPDQLVIPRITVIANRNSRAIEGNWEYFADGGSDGQTSRAQILRMGETNVIWLQPDGSYIQFHLNVSYKPIRYQQL